MHLQLQAELHKSIGNLQTVITLDGVQNEQDQDAAWQLNSRLQKTMDTVQAELTQTKADFQTATAQIEQLNTDLENA
ncbi:hypothetical protein KJE20_11500 [Pyrenophora tritici-repentis]|nr:hypothetical protein KJE20_11500 [Pyrenophora tritici-repentis]